MRGTASKAVQFARCGWVRPGGGDGNEDSGTAQVSHRVPKSPGPKAGQHHRLLTLGRGASGLPLPPITLNPQ